MALFRNACDDREPRWYIYDDDKVYAVNYKEGELIGALQDMLFGGHHANGTPLTERAYYLVYRRRRPASAPAEPEPEPVPYVYEPLPMPDDVPCSCKFVQSGLEVTEKALLSHAVFDQTYVKELVRRAREGQGQEA